MRVWLASFPRSGNTFLRNLLFDVYELTSATYHLHTDHIKDENWQDYDVVKTHLLPSEIPELQPEDKVIYLVRDGRDACCSIAHHRKDIVAPGTDFLENLTAAIYAEKGSFFGGWEQNAKAWLERCNLLIRYEDLVRDTATQLKRIEKLLQLPTGDFSKAKTFQDLKLGAAKYGAGADHGFEEKRVKELAHKNFRKGKIGSWKEEMPIGLQHLFWSFYCETLEHFGYSRNGEELDTFNADLDWKVVQKLEKEQNDSTPVRTLLIEADKLRNSSNDGIKRYTLELVKGLAEVAENPHSRWKIDLLVNRKIVPVQEWKKVVNQQENEFQKVSSRAKKIRLPYPLKVARNLFWEAFGLLPKMVREAYNNAFNKAVVWRRNRLVEKSFNELIPQLESYDLIHLTLPQHYFFFKKINARFVTTIHDLSHLHFPHFHEAGNIHNAQRGVEFLQKKESGVIAVSEYTLNDVKNHLTVAQDKCFVAQEGVDRHHFRRNPNQEVAKEVYKKYGLPADEPYILSLSTLEPRKNLVNTIKAFNKLLNELPHLKVNLVIAGKKGWKIEELLLLQQVEPDRVFFTDYIQEEDLPVLYTNALALVYVSHFEGFGLPLLEAMNCGTPVVYGYNSSQIEVAEHSGYPVTDTNSVEAIKIQIESALTLHPLREEKSLAALQQAGNFSWRRSLIDTIACYRKLLS